MGSVLKITRNGVITLPAKFRRSLGLREGDLVNAELRDNAIVVRKAAVVDAEDAWFHTKEWQAMEAEADADIAAGRVAGPFLSVEEFRADLDDAARRSKSKSRKSE
ncbi:MAG: AbrB/MazE/SpoVT family DNA-binding domain-containing protein [Deltaproteobacteria bacterium]|nr:AbrB/MazE/SpoVT family DNA-binding domain-containing protein [Deltaproteobacteria bacterium]